MKNFIKLWDNNYDINTVVKNQWKKIDHRKKKSFYKAFDLIISTQEFQVLRVTRKNLDYFQM